MGKDFHAAFSNMNKAVRPGVGQSAVVQPVGETDKKKVTRREEEIDAWSSDISVGRGI